MDRYNKRNENTNNRFESTNYETAIFAGGCFWCMEPPFRQMDGVIEVVSGYTGGTVKNPTYEQVCSGTTGHREAVQITFDPLKVSYSELLDIFWLNIDPIDAGGQFEDRGDQYKTAIFYHNEAQRAIAEISKIVLNASGWFDKPVVTVIRKAVEFYAAEEYHQDYFNKNPLKYKFYEQYSERHLQIAKRLEKELRSKWGIYAYKTYKKPSLNELKERLTPLQYHVTQENGTEPPFENEYWKNDKKGIYVDIISGEPLFASTDKYDSGTGWPSFWKPIKPGALIYNVDPDSLQYIEIKSRIAKSHLGHVFYDGPKPTGLRFCINSAALRFVSLDDMDKEGYGEFIVLIK
ncbi:MAG TPA: peptide-methionine (S)-S-oxide reductase MsrA [Clostridiaceae bacterium]|nr:peptide-methionine (S)-S-oxide reductase MsrA [Clostridiaceae bacterium]